MDEVIRLMKQCGGAIVLGVPQIEVRAGVLKGNDIDEPFSLGTEWNHIEAALAYALELPTLVIHDQTVVRGCSIVEPQNRFCMRWISPAPHGP